MKFLESRLKLHFGIGSASRARTEEQRMIDRMAIAAVENELGGPSELQREYGELVDLAAFRRPLHRPRRPQGPDSAA